MALEKTRTEEQEGPDGLGWTDCRTQSGGPSRPGVAQAHSPASSSTQSTTRPVEGLPSEPSEPSDPQAEARSRLQRMQLNAVKEELRRAELAFLSAKKLLPDEAGRGAAERIAEALRRCNLSVDSVVQALAVALANITPEQWKACAGIHTVAPRRAH